MSEQPLSLQWLCFIRDHGQDLKVTLGERALASILPTYGQGKNIFVSMHTLAKVTGWSRNTVKKHRDGLIVKGLIEDITGDPDKQSRTYRLTMPGYVGQTLTPLGQNLTPLGQILTPPGSDSDPNIKPEIERDIERKINITPGEARDDGVAASQGDQSQNHGEGEDSPADGEAEPDWTGEGKDAQDNRAWLAERLSVPVESIGAPLWRWLEGLGMSDHSTADFWAVTDAAKKASGGRSPVGLFQAILPGFLAEYRAVRERLAARGFSEDMLPEDMLPRDIRRIDLGCVTNVGYGTRVLFHESGWAFAVSYRVEQEKGAPKGWTGGWVSEDYWDARESFKLRAA